MTSDSYFTLGFYVRKPQTERAEYPIFARISVAGQVKVVWGKSLWHRRYMISAQKATNHAYCLIAERSIILR